MEPLVALGLASNLVQFVDFASKLVTRARETYKSVDGALVDNSELQAVTEHLQRLTGRLHVSSKGPVNHFSSTEKQLHDLCSGSRDAIAELLAALGRLKTKGNHNRWNSFRQALESVWKESEIQSLAIRLERFRRQIDTTLLVLLREQVDQAVLSSDLRTKRVSEQLLGFIDDTKTWQADLIETLHQNNWHSHSQEDTALFSSKLSSAVLQSEDLSRLRIRELLRFPSISDRYESIDEAHKRTFEWIFDQSPATSGQQGQDPMARHQVWDSFVQWLHDTESLYWLCGKPGSGKSTLMKYLYDDPRTSQHLQDWASDLPLVKAAFFSWNSGTQMQMSQMGLLQTLLYEATQDRPALISCIFPRRWRSYLLFGGDLHPWTWSELALAMKILTSDSGTRFAFFVDGLDEFDGDGAQLVKLLIDITTSPNVKICAASRPWLVFEEAFSSHPRLRLEDLTAPDVQLYVSEKLQRNAMFLQLQKQGPQLAQDLILEVTGKACGVFLWVRLVVQSLLEGLRDGDTIADLQARLLALPSDLQELFRRILDRLNPHYFAQASRIFQIVRESPEPLAILELSFAEDGFELALQAEVAPLSPDEITFRVEVMRRRLISRCKGLLEVPSLEVLGPATRVQYLHRTVKDFLASPEIWRYILSGSAQSFDPRSALYASYIMQIKKMEPHKDMFPGLWAVIRACMEYAHSIQSKHNSDQLAQAAILALDEMDSAACHLLNGKCEVSGTSWLVEASHTSRRPNFVFEPTVHWGTPYYFLEKPNLAPTKRWRFLFPLTSFLDCAFVSGLDFYVGNKIQNDSTKFDSFQGPEWLELAADFREQNSPDVNMANFNMVQLLLKHGVNPNTQKPGRSGSPWQTLLRQPALDGSVEIERWLKLVSLYLEHGADPYIQTPRGSVLQTIKTMCRSPDPELSIRMDEVIGILKSRQRAKQRPKTESRVTESRVTESRVTESLVTESRVTKSRVTKSHVHLRGLMKLFRRNNHKK
ncbi:hypothetical protein GJ744_000676 [Endocarpon pusillum]|uniref:NACHT domain-containing protein n=1 Tax=Endocarpon pusillum TaxID=364733 RepID=A0A8H7ACH1_9EURO|nr:hypothetical protein GJ744_000676 [Endocarpon pusillum]